MSRSLHLLLPWPLVIQEAWCYFPVQDSQGRRGQRLGPRTTFSAFPNPAGSRKIWVCMWHHSHEYTSLSLSHPWVLQVGSRRVIVAAGCVLLVMGVFGKIGAAFVTIPTPVIGGTFLVMFGVISAMGISNLQVRGVRHPQRGSSIAPLERSPQDCGEQDGWGLGEEEEEE